MRATRLRWFALLALLVAMRGTAGAGCIGPVIAGECKGAVVEWDTHPQRDRHPDAMGGSYFDWRGSADQRQRHWQDIDPDTGRDANDSQWGQPSHAVPMFPPPPRDDDATEEE